MPANRYVIYDDETTGLDYDYDQVLECAMLTLDESFQPIEDSERVFSVRPRVDVPPHPEACLTHGLNLARLRETGISEYDFARQFLDYVRRPNTYIGGYNNLQFDDEVTRRLMFRNLRDPYSHEWRDGNRRFDVLSLARMLYAWEPETLSWPTNDDGELTLSLSALSKANHIVHENAHDAMSDVRATAGLLSLISALGTTSLNRWLQLTDKRHAERLVARRTPLFHVSSFYSKSRCYSSLILPVIRDRTSANKVLCIDLAEDPTDLLSMDPVDIRRYLFTPRDQLEENPPTCGARAVQLNKQPLLADLPEVAPSLHGRMGIDLQVCLERAKQIAADRDLASRLQEAFDTRLPEPADVYGTLYSGSFFSRPDTARRDNAHLPVEGDPRAARESASTLMRGAEDARLVQLAVRLQGLNFPYALTKADDHDAFLQYLNRRLYDDEFPGLTLAQARDALNLCRLDRVLSPQEEAILEDLSRHYEWIEEEAKRLTVRPLDMTQTGLPALQEGVPTASNVPARTNGANPAATSRRSGGPVGAPESGDAIAQPTGGSSPMGFPTSLVRGQADKRINSEQDQDQDSDTVPCPF